MTGYSLSAEYKLRKIISEQAVEIIQLLKRITELEELPERPYVKQLLERVAELEKVNRERANDNMLVLSKYSQLEIEANKRIAELEVNLNALQTKYEELADDYIDLKESK